MAEVSATLVKELREKTQAGMLDCKKALSETNGDMTAAIKYLREKGLSSAAKKSGREAAQGVIGIKIAGNVAAMLELNAETDFVAKNENFLKLLNDLLAEIIAKKPATIDDFMGQAAIEEMVKGAIAIIGENLVPRKLAVYEVGAGNLVTEYIHMNGSIGVLLETKNVDGAVAKDIAMHIAAAAPAYLNRTQVDNTVLLSEKEVYKQQARNEGKPENILEKIAEGKLNKFYKDNCLLEQIFVKDQEKTISQLLAKDTEILRFARFQLGA